MVVLVGGGSSVRAVSSPPASQLRSFRSGREGGGLLTFAWSKIMQEGKTTTTTVFVQSWSKDTLGMWAIKDEMTSLSLLLSPCSPHAAWSTAGGTGRTPLSLLQAALILRQKDHGHIWHCQVSLHYLPTVCQIGGAIWLGSTSHGCPRPQVRVPGR